MRIVWVVKFFEMFILIGKFYVLLLQAVDAIDAAFAGELAHAADGLVGGGAAGGAGSEVHLAFCVLVH